MKKALFTLSIVLLAFCKIATGQEKDYHLDKDNMSFFKEAELVVEGRFLKPLHAYAVKDADGKEHYYGICPVIAYRVFKGDAKAGDTIYVTREGTSLYDVKSPHPFDDSYETIYDESTGSYEKIIIEIQYVAPAIASTKNINVSNPFMNDCVIFLKTSTYPTTQDERYSTLKQYQYLYPYVFYDEGTLLYVSEGRFAGLNDTIFNSRQDLYEFMRKAGGYDLSVIGADTVKNNQSNSEKSKYPMIKVGPPSYPSKKNQKADCYPDKPLPPEVEKRWGDKKKINSTKNNTDLYLSFNTPQLRYNHSLNRACVEVDLCVHTNQNNVYFDGGHVRVVYDTLAFGINVANTGLFDVSFCPDFTNSSYCLYNVNNINHKTLDILSGLDFEPDQLQRVLLDTLPKPFLHLSFVVNLDSVSHNIVFQNVAATGEPTYANSANATFFDYYYFDHIFYLSSNTIELPDDHTPTILEKNVTPKIAGIGDTLNLRGINFGDAKGEVLFKAADDGGQSDLRGLDDQYHLYWSDTLIQVLVPSLVYKGYESLVNHNWSGGAGSGNIKIQTINGDTNVHSEIDNIYVQYSITNAIKGDSFIRRVYLVRQNCDYDFQFTLHRSLEGDSTKIFVIDTALRLWSNLTGLTLQLERDASGNIVFEDTTNILGKNIIYIDTLPFQGAMSTDKIVERINIAEQNTILYRNTKSNIRIKSQPTSGSWSYDLSGYVQNQISFYQAFLHEIGHILLLGHVNDMGNVMYYQLRRYCGILVPDTSSWAVKGVLANIEASRNINWPSNSGLYPIGVRQPKITVADNQAPILCNGASLTLQSNYPTEPHVWSTGETTLSITIQNGGQYTLSIPDEGCNLSDTIQIGNSALQANLITTPTTCPNGADGSITAQVTGNYPPFTYQWSGNGITPSDTPHINNLETGTYYLTLTDSVGCQLQLEDTVLSTIEELQVCIVGIDSGCSPSPLFPDLGHCKRELVANISGGQTPYQICWFYSLPNGTSPSNPNCESMDYYVCNVNLRENMYLYLSVQDACGQLVFKTIPWYVLQNKSFSAKESWNVSLFPNPANNHIEVRTENTDNIKQVQVYDVCGRLLQTLEANNHSMRIDVSNLAAGMYFVRVVSKNETKTISFVKK